MCILTLLMLLMTPAESADTLSASVVSSGRHGSLSVRTFTSWQVSSMPSATVPDLLRHMAGVQIRDYGGLGGLKTVNVRSLGSQHTGVFIDGVKISNVQNGQVDLGRYPAEDMESISVVNSISQSMLQSASELASASTVRLRTMFPDFSRPWSLTAKGEYGSFGTGSAYLSAGKRLSDRFFMKFSGDFRHTDGDYPFVFRNVYGADTTARRQNSDLTSFRLSPSLYMRSGRFRLHLSGGWFHSGRGLPGPVIRQSGQYRSSDRQNDDNIFVQTVCRYSDKDFSLKITGKYAYDLCNYVQDTLWDKSAAYRNLHYRQQEGYVSVSAAYRFGNFAFSLAWDGSVFHLSSDVAGLSGKLRLSSLAAARVRYSYRNFSADASLVYDHSSDFSLSRPGISETVRTSVHDRPCPFVSVSWSPGKFGFMLYWKNSFRLPTFNELYYVAVPSANVAHALDPETVDQFDFAASFRTSAGIWSCDLGADLFYNITKDKIVWLPAANQFVWSAFNYGLVHGYGATLSMDHSLVSGDFGMNLRADYSYMRSKDMTDPQSPWYGGQIAYVPLHSVSAGLILSYRDWSLSAGFICNSVRYRTSANIASDMLAPYACLDVMLSRTLWKFMKISLAAANITDTHYEIVSRYPMPGVSCRMTVQFNF